MLCPIIVILTKTELDRGLRIAELRRLESQSMSRKQNHGHSRGEFDPDIPGALGELAFCKAMGFVWEESLNTFKRPDHGSNIQVRCAPCRARFPPTDFGNLIVRADDNPSHRYVLVVGNAPNFAVKGWMLGRDAMRKEWWGVVHNNGREAVWRVPHGRLNLNMEDFINH